MVESPLDLPLNFVLANILTSYFYERVRMDVLLDSLQFSSHRIIIINCKILLSFLALVDQGRFC
jgi:hypothetical protein